MDKIDRRRFLMLAAAAAAGQAFSPGCSTFSQDRPACKTYKNGLKIANATVISMKKGFTPEISDVYIRGNKITGISKPGAAGENVESTIDASGKYLIPALIESHCHITQMRMLSRYIMDPLYLAAGVTTVRDMAVAEADWDNEDWGGRFDDLEFKGPRVLRVAGFFDGPPGVFSWAIIPESKEDVEEYLDEVVEYKINAIKIYSYMKPDILKYLADGASRRNLYVAGHVPLCMSAIEAADAGIQEFQHNLGMTDTMLNEKDESFFRNMRKFGHSWLRMKSREDEMRKLAAELTKRKVVTVPTLVVMRGLGNIDLPDLNKDPRMRYLPAYVPETIWGKDNPMLQKWTPEDFEACRKSIPVSGLFTRMLKEEGATILAGTDCPGSNAFPGFGLHDELKCLVEYSGFTAEEALAAATSVPARVFGVDDKIGTIEQGKNADLLILDENPLKDIGATEKIRAIIFNGKVTTREDIDRQLKDMEEKFQGFYYDSIMRRSMKWGTNIGFGFIMPDPPGGWENQ